MKITKILYYENLALYSSYIGTYVHMYHFAWVDPREKLGYISDVSLKRGIQRDHFPRMHLDVSWENDPFDLCLIYKPYSDQLTYVGESSILYIVATNQCDCGF